MKLAVLSGKGGTGKTFVSVSLAAAAEKATYIDCDVEEPNGRLFLKPQQTESETVYTLLPAFDTESCTGCRKCADFCRFHALVFLKGRPRLFPELCHACMGCTLVCPAGAVGEKKKAVGTVECGRSGSVRVVTGCMALGESSGVPVIKAALSKTDEQDPLTVIDCPPGSACAVTESIGRADYCVLVAEPTAFGLDNFRMVQELCALQKKPCGVIINKEITPYPPLEDFCREKGLPVLARIPYNADRAERLASGGMPVREDRETKALFLDILKKITGEAAE